MNTYAINDNHDMHVLNGQIARVSKSDAIMQLIKTRLLTVQEEWFMDLSAGLPWYTKMLTKPTDLYKIRSYLSREITSTEGVDSLLSLELQYNNGERKLDVEFKYTDTYGNTLEGVI